MKRNLLKPCPPDEFTRAIAIVCRFAEVHGWLEYCDTLQDMPVAVAADQQSLCSYLQDIGELEGSGPPGLVAAALEKQILILEPQGVKKIRPEYLALDDGWVRLLAHEFAHLFHEALVDGQNEQLGPRWFFEGFACVVAGQHLGVSFDTESPQQVLQAVRTQGRRQYASFEAAVRYFICRYTVEELVERAGTEHFEEWLVNNAEENQAGDKT